MLAVARSVVVNAPVARSVRRAVVRWSMFVRTPAWIGAVIESVRTMIVRRLFSRQTTVIRPTPATAARSRQFGWAAAGGREMRDRRVAHRARDRGHGLR